MDELEELPFNNEPELAYLLSYALNSTADGVALLDADHCVRYLNEAACTLLGLSCSRLLGHNLESLLTPRIVNNEVSLLEAIESHRILTLELSSHQGSPQNYISMQFRHFQYDRKYYVLALIHDLSEQRRMADTLLRNERQLRIMIENIPDAIGRFTPDFRLIYANPALEALCRLPLVEVCGRPAWEAFGENSQVDIMADMVRQVADSGESVEEELIRGIDGPADQQSHYLVQMVPERNTSGDVTNVISLARDITDIRKAERRLAESNRQLRELTRRRESAREEERKLIASEIHDELGQHLTALRMGISMMRLRYGEQNPGLNGHVEQLMEICDRTIQVVRSVTTNLRPTVLNMGLYPALEWLINDFRSHHPHILCEFVAHSGEPKLDDNLATTAFRIVQEALTNIARHSGASRAVVSLERLDDQYRLDITDNGVGFKPDNVGKNSLGLAGMRERGICLGGEVVIFSHPGQGTTIQATFPATENKDLQ